MMRSCYDTLVPKKKRYLYEKLPEQQDKNTESGDFVNSSSSSSSKQSTARWGNSGLCHRLLDERLLLVTALALVVVFTTRAYLSFPDKPEIPSHHEKIPTFLSVRDDRDGQFLYALDNPLYDEIKKVTLYHQENSSSSNKNNHKLGNAAPSSSSSTSSLLVNLSTTSLTQGQPLTVEWSSSSSSSSRRVDHVKPQDVWVLYCGQADWDDDTLWQYTNMYEVATVAQVQTTTMAACRDDCASELSSSSSSSSSSFWYIPHFPMWHRQEVCQFVLYRKVKPLQWQKLVVSPRIDTLQAVTSPTHVHLALTHDPTQMTIQFTSAKGTPIVAYATEANPSKWIDGHVAGTTTTYEASDLCMAPANETGPGKFQSPGLLHTVVLTDLQPNTKYVYKAGIQHGQGVTWSDTATFTTAPLPNDTSIYPFTYLAYADQGCPLNGWDQGAAWTADVLAQEVASIRMVHHFGDLSYAQGSAHQWDAWQEMIEPISRSVPYHIGIGNHEYDYTAGGQGKDPTGNDEGYHPVWGNFKDDSGGECGVPTSKRFQMPDSPGGVFWYAHNFGNVHTIVLSSEHDLAPDSVQYKWLADDLAQVNRTATPWIIVETHRPLYEGEAVWEQNDVGIALRMELEHLLHDYNVDLVLAGHYHAYHRTCDGLYKGRCDHGGPMHMTVGTAGAHLDEADLFDNPWTAVYIKKTYGYGRITIYNATDLQFEFVQGAASEDDPQAGQILDNVWIHRVRE